MYIVSIHKLESRRSGKDRRERQFSGSGVVERRSSKDRRVSGDRRKDIGRRYGLYRVISDHQKEKLDKIINIRDVEVSDLVIG